MKLGLPAEYFTSKQIFDDESKRIFSRHWLCLGRSDEIPEGSFRTYSIERASLLVTRTGRLLSAVHNVCRHRGAILCEQESGRVAGDCFRCPYHSWTYAASGELLNAPNMQDHQSWDKTKFGLHRVACCEWNGYIFVNFDIEPEPLERAFVQVFDKFDPWAMHTLTVGSTMEYEVRANWKLIFQNYSECYHCPTVHPALNRLTPYKTAGNDVVTGLVLGGPMQMSEGVETMSTDGKFVGPLIPTLRDEQKRLVAYYTAFPSMFISPHPDYVMVHRLRRLAPNRTAVRCELLFHGDEKVDPDRAAEFWDQTNRQDWHVCELVQQGAETSGYVPGPYSQLETVLPMFDELYLRVMGT